MILPLAACLGGEGLTRMVPESEKQTAPLRRVGFFGGDVIAAGPQGFCVDPGSVQKGRGTGFALLADCAHMGALHMGDVPPAVVTISVLARDARAVQPTARSLAAPLQESGIRRMIDGDGIALVQLARGGDGMLQGGDPGHWRAALLINGHIVGLAAYGEPGSGVDGRAGYELLLAVGDAMRGASAEQRAPPPDEAAPPEPADPTEARAPGSAEDGARRVAQRSGGKTTSGGLNSILSGLFRVPA